MNGTVVRGSRLVKEWEAHGRVTCAVREVDVDMPAHTMVAVTGHRSSGKSTLVRLLCGMCSPTSGAVWWDGVRLSDLCRSDARELRDRVVGVVRPQPFFGGGLSVEESVELPLALLGVPSARRAALTTRALDLVGITPVRRERLGAVNRSVRLAAAVARAAAKSPDLLIADEPTATLDHDDRMRFVATLALLRAETGVTVAVATRDHVLAAQADLVIRLAEGEVVEQLVHGRPPVLGHDVRLPIEIDMEATPGTTR